jgi:IS30 family transposase
MTTDIKKKAKEKHIREWAILRLKKGYIPKQIALDIQKLYGVSVTMMTIYRWRVKHNANNKDFIPLSMPRGKDRKTKIKKAKK